MTLFSFLRDEEPVLQLYGKLPIAKDYLRVGCGEGAARALREWMDQAFSARVEEERSPVLPYAMRFAWFSGSEALLGVIWPSTDAGGLRPFPIVLAVERRRRTLLEELRTSSREPERWWRAIERKRSDLDAPPDGATFLAAARGTKVQTGPKVETESNGIDFDGWISALWPARGREGLERSLLDLLVLASGGASTPLRMPMVWGMHLSSQAHAWWTALETARDGRGGPASLFFPVDATSVSTPAMAILFRTTPSARDQRWLLGPSDAAHLGDGDFCPSGHCPQVDARPVPERMAPLANSLCGTMTGLRERRG